MPVAPHKSRAFLEMGLEALHHSLIDEAGYMDACSTARPEAQESRGQQQQVVVCADRVC